MSFLRFTNDPFENVMRLQRALSFLASTERASRSRTWVIG
jgi:hypothetical protein